MYFHGHNILIMKYIFILAFAILAAAPIGLMAQKSKNKKATPSTIGRKVNELPDQRYKLSMLDGRWQEVSRQRSTDKGALRIEDTIYIRFIPNGTAETTQGGSATITGTTSIGRNDYMSTSANDWRIVSLTDDKMTLDNLDGILHNFERTIEFAFERNHNIFYTIGDTSAQKVDISAASLVANWFVYRRGAAPGSVSGTASIIRNLKITSGDKDNYTGEIEYSIGPKVTTEPCTLSFSGRDLQIKSTTQTWNTKVFKADGKELMMGKKGELIYYFKPI